MYFLYNKTPVFYQNKGSGNSLLFLHGWGADSSLFKNLIDYYQKYFNCLALDFPPFGLSEKINCDYTVTEYKNLVLGLLDKLNIKKTDIICHSFGGRVALKLGAENPDRINKIVICSGAGMPYKFSLKKGLKRLTYKLYKFFYKIKIVKQKSLNKFFSDDYKNLPENMKKTFVNIINEDLTSFAKKVKCDTLIVWGIDDKQTPLYMAKMLNKYIINSKIAVIKGNHYSFLYNQKDFLNVTNKFLI